jgi:hypothetical protein
VHEELTRRLRELELRVAALEDPDAGAQPPS